MNIPKSLALRIRSKLSTRLIVSSCILLLSIVLISVISISVLRHLQSQIHEKSKQELNTITNNSNIARDIFSLVSKIEIFDHSRLNNRTDLVNESLAIDQQLQEIRSLTLIPEMIGVLDEISINFNRYMGNLLTHNLIIEEQNNIDLLLGQQLEEINRAMYKTSRLNASVEFSTVQHLNWKQQYQKLREFWLETGKKAAGIQNRLSPSEISSIATVVEDQLKKLRAGLEQIKLINKGLYPTISTINKTAKKYSSSVKKLRVNLIQRWKILEDLHNSTNKLLAIVENSETNMASAFLQNQQSLEHNILNFGTLILLTAIFLATLGIYLVARFIRNHINSPMQNIINGIDMFEAGKPLQNIELNRIDEWSRIEKAFISMTQRLAQSYSKLHDEQKRFDFLAHHDPLTGLANRLLIQSQLDDLITDSRDSKKPFCVMYMDLDQFKRINDSLGHSVGDSLLKEVSRRLTNIIQENGMAARLGGDEFMVLLPDVSTSVQAETLAQEINISIAQPVALDEQEVFVTNSIGICFYPKDGNSTETLIRNADTALYQAKRAGRDCMRLYTDEMTSHAHQLINQNSAMRHALEKDEFLLLYQPKYNLLTGDVTGAEALIRWQHPDIGLLTPNRFLPIAEETGLITEIDDWVFEKVSQQIVSWQNNDLDIAGMKFSCNCSGRQFLRGDLNQKLTSILKATGCEPGMIEIEITEQDIMTNLETCAQMMKKLRDSGIELAIDDFGTGYSSLSYLKHLPATTLKIDRSFVQDICTNQTDLAIVQSIISLSQNMNMQVIAEGIENEDQSRLLKEMGCHFGQGYYFSYPLLVGSYEKLLNSSLPNKVSYINR